MAQFGWQRALKAKLPIANRASKERNLPAAKLMAARRQRTKPPSGSIAVGRHRLQIDIQQLAAMAGNSGYEYKTSLIDLASRVKYCEIHPARTTQTLAAGCQRAQDSLPPFFSSLSDNAISFTSKVQRASAASSSLYNSCKAIKTDAGDNIPKASPRHHRLIQPWYCTANEELFQIMLFGCFEQRRYYLKLWEFEYNHHRLDQGIGNRTPMQVYRQNYSLDAATRMLT